jgi:hypothetical protein
MSLVAYPKNVIQARDMETGGTGALPKSLVATDYHVLLLYKHSVQALCVLNGDVIFEDTYEEVRLSELNLYFSSCKVKVNDATIYRTKEEF